jgi:hypothetical protein
VAPPALTLDQVDRRVRPPSRPCALSAGSTGCTAHDLAPGQAVRFQHICTHVPAWKARNVACGTHSSATVRALLSGLYLRNAGNSAQRRSLNCGPACAAEVCFADQVAVDEPCKAMTKDGLSQLERQCTAAECPGAMRVMRFSDPSRVSILSGRNKPSRRQNGHSLHLNT